MSGASILNLFVRRYRLLFYIVGGYFIAVACIGFLPKGTVPQYMGGVFLPPAFLGLFVTLAAFSNPEADLAGEGSGYPPFILRMPVKTISLAAWPILGVILWSTMAWIFLAAFIMRPLGFNVPIWWPATVVAAVGTTLQALLWVPLRLGILRIIPALILPLFLIYFAMWMSAGAEFRAEKIAVIYGGYTILASLAGVYGVFRARTAGVVRRVAREVTFKDKVRNLPPFRSPLAAHFWVEWRKQGRILPMVTAIVLGLLSLPMLKYEPYLYERGDLGGYIKVNPWFGTFIFSLFLVPFVTATVLGMGAMRSYLRSPEGSYHLFFATRPLTSAQLLRAKYLSITAGVLTSWAILGVVTFLWLLTRAEDHVRTGTTLSFLIERTDTAFWIKFALGSVLLMAWTWRNQIVGVFADYVPFPAIRGIYALVVSISGATIYLLLGLFARPLAEQRTNAILFTALSILLALKLVAAGLAGWRLMKLNPAAKRELGVSIATWLVAAVLLGSNGVYIGQFAIDNGFSKSIIGFPNAPLAIIVLIPLARPIAAKLALEVGRHRG